MDTYQAIQTRKKMTVDCRNCFALCCTALNIVASSDFAINKPAGIHCQNLNSDFRCQIHSTLREKGFKGCTVYDCLGAGQHVSQYTFNGKSWREYPEIATKMYQVFPIVEQLIEMKAFILEAFSYRLSPMLYEQLVNQLNTIETLVNENAEVLLNIDTYEYQVPISELLSKASNEIQRYLSKDVFHIPKGKNMSRKDFIGKNFANQDFRTYDLRGTYFIAANLQNADLRGANLIGVDLRDANLNGANLSSSLFLTQMQVNSAKGNSKTILPAHIQQPPYWNI
ncbi:MAG TPA: pentapeptide repeat-containing protein [Rummeliibacillus sp.]|nr:pentapeptide repeat-containing protein [Rummeliibacillus sp.]